MSLSGASLSACPPAGLREPPATCYRRISNETRGHPENSPRLALAYGNGQRMKSGAEGSPEGSVRSQDWASAADSSTGGCRAVQPGVRGASGQRRPTHP